MVDRVLRHAHEDVLAELDRLFEERRRTGYWPLHDLVADYPFPRGQGLVPRSASPPVVPSDDRNDATAVVRLARGAGIPSEMAPQNSGRRASVV